MSSSKHRKVVLKELNAAQVSTEITPDELVSLVAMAKASKEVSFTYDYLPLEGRYHTRSLKIIVICNKKRVPEVLVDNDSALNICPLSTAETLGFGPGDFIPSEQGILAYDGTRRDVIGTLVGVIPSTLHRKLKFIHNNRVVIVKGDPDLEIRQISQELIAGKADDITLTGAGLGKYHQGPTEWPEFRAFNGLFGLGYEPTEQEGADFLICGFAEPWTDDVTGQRLPGFEIFFDLELTEEPMSTQITEVAPKTDWADVLEPECLNGMFQTEDPVVTMISSEAEASADSMVGRETKTSVVAMIGTVEVGPGSGVGDESLSNKVESENTLDDEFNSSTAHMPELAESDNELSVESVNTSLESNTMPAVGYSILDVINSMNEMKDSFTYVSVSPVSISKWLANIVLVPKKDGKFKMCVNFRDLNKIKMAPEAMIKTTFTTQWGTYCYRPLLLYLSFTNTTMGCMLAQQGSESKKEKPIYYISKKILEYEVKYTILEKTCLALVWATQRLRHYLLSNKVLMLSRMDSLKYLFEKPTLTGRTARWLLLLSEFDITYVTQKSVKGQEYYFYSLVHNNALATLASMLDIPATMEVQPLTVRLQWEPAHVNVIEIAAKCPDVKPWYTDIRNLISGEGHPPEASGKERRTLQRLAAHFVICGEQLYRRSFDGIQLLCVDEDKAAELIEPTHEELHSLTLPWSFSVWGIDIIGKVFSKSSSGHEYILVAIDYFTKWIEAASYTSLTSTSVAKFIRTNIICRYGVLYELISDNGSLQEGMYGMEAVLPVELRIPSLRVMMEASLSESE
ncbi:uncharacterized protein LOC143869845 [Tasmannia lanceolata]|uniref:uncharacterized protein LOC143869845 n=1 Tax=Tasmannia lanceolata TaxID=3420 RepID=UPI0040642F07